MDLRLKSGLEYVRFKVKKITGAMMRKNKVSTDEWASRLATEVSITFFYILRLLNERPQPFLDRGERFAILRDFGRAKDGLKRAKRRNCSLQDLYVSVKGKLDVIRDRAKLKIFLDSNWDE